MNENEAAKELEEARLTIKKLQRELKHTKNIIERNRITYAAKDNLSQIVSQKKSELEKYMALLLENCPDIIMIFEKDGKLIYCTNAFLRITHTAGFGLMAGIRYQEILERYTNPILLEKAKKIYIDQQKPSREASIYLNDTIDFGGDGNWRNYGIQITPMSDETGGNMGAIVIFYDTTEILQAQREAEKANQAKSDFLATVSHEIRTPMNAIIGLSNMLRISKLSEEQQNLVKNIQSSSNVLLNLINDILDFSKIEAGKLELVADYFDLPVLLNRLRTMFELLYSDKDLSLRCDFAESVPQVVFGDEKRIGQVITNLLSNALKYTPEGGVRFRVFTEGLENKEKILVVEVEDTGIGIKKEAIPRLFTAFQQLDLVRNKQVQGTGLGLVITQKLCEMMGGSISVESEYNKGSVFTIRLRLKTGTAADLPEEAKAVDVFTAPEARVLLVDDIDINLEIAAFVLSGYDITVDLAKSGLEALEKVRENHYDLILMDHMMPEMDGVEATREIRAMGGTWATVPIIALTANAVSGTKEMFLTAGFNGLLPKPMDNNALAETLLKWLPETLVIRG